MLLHHEPLVVAHAVDDEEEHRPRRFQMRENVLVDHMRRQHDIGIVQPALVVLFNELAELLIALAALVGHGLLQAELGMLIELEFRLHEAAVQRGPLLEVHGIEEHARDFVELLNVFLRGLRSENLSTLEEFLHGDQHLAWIDWLGQIIRDFLADRLLHQRFRLVFRYHHHGERGTQIFELGERRKAAHAGHGFVEEHDIDGICLRETERVLAVRYRVYRVPLLFEKKDVRTE